MCVLWRFVRYRTWEATFPSGTYLVAHVWRGTGYAVFFTPAGSSASRELTGPNPASYFASAGLARLYVNQREGS